MKIAVAISGGVDSSVAALLLKRAGHDVFGLFMKNWEEDDNEQCAAALDLEFVEKTCTRLDIPLHTVNFSAEYWERVFKVFLREYRVGRTPNPDVLCNREIKFKRFMEHARTLEADKIATGHYAGIRRRNSDWYLLKAEDITKDQSYFLHLLEQEVLAQLLFPLAEMTKKQVREVARREGLATHDRKDSTGICFIGERHFRDFLSTYLESCPGDILDETGKVIGRHCGAWFYTIGQRAGLGVGGTRGGAEKPWYVVDKDIEANRLTVVQGNDHPALFSSSLIAENVHWINRRPPRASFLAAKIRYRQPDQHCRLVDLGTNMLQVNFEHPQRAVVAGQSIVFYQGQTCLGGGVIADCA